MADAAGERLVAELACAFGDAERPPDETLVVGRSMDARRIQAAFAGREWTSLGLREVVEHKYGLAFLTARALHYFLPAYLRATVSNYPETDVIAGNVLAVLSPPESTEDLAQWRVLREFLGHFSPDQRGAIDTYLTWLSDHHGDDFPTGEPGVDEPTLVRRQLRAASAVVGR